MGSWRAALGLGGATSKDYLNRGPVITRDLLGRGSSVRRLCQRHGFVHRFDADNGVDRVFTTNRFLPGDLVPASKSGA